MTFVCFMVEYLKYRRTTCSLDSKVDQENMGAPCGFMSFYFDFWLKRVQLLKNNFQTYTIQRMTINSLPIETIKYYAQQYANTLKYHRQHQKVYQKTDVGRKNSQKRSSKYYFRKNNIYHPQYNNSPTAKEGRKYKRNKNKH